MKILTDPHRPLRPTPRPEKPRLLTRLLTRPVPYLMTCLMTGLLAALGVAGCDGGGEEGVLDDGFVTSGGIERSYQVYVPPTYEPGRAAPLVVVFHGVPGSGASMRQFASLDAMGDDNGWLIAYPDATSDWAEGCNGCARSDREGVDDVQFTADLIDALRDRYAVDHRRVYALGYSQGGLFAQRLACDLPGRIAATAVLAATMSVPRANACDPAALMPMLIMHGEQDTVFPWEGKEDGLFSTLSAEAAALKWAAFNGCTAGTTTDDDPPGTGRASVRLKTYTGCPAEGPVYLYRLEGFGHDWPRHFDVRALVAGFFSGYTRP